MKLPPLAVTEVRLVVLKSDGMTNVKEIPAGNAFRVLNSRVTVVN